MPDAGQDRVPAVFSVIIPTRNRPALLQRALISVCAQTLPPQDIVVVVDGATGPDLAAYNELASSLAAHPLHWHHLPHRPTGHGPSFTRNAGVSLSRGEYLCFLDDDDVWSDPGHLHRLQRTVQSHGPVDLYMTSQSAVLPDGTPVTGPLWLDGLQADCPGPSDALGNWRVPVAALARRIGFSHLNCSAYRRVFFESLGGLDELLRYEEDRDLYLRAIDAAASLIYNPAVTACHHVPDRQAQANASTAWNRPAQLLQQLRMLDKCIIGARHPGLRWQARTLKAYALHDVAAGLEAQGRLREAAAYRREALTQRLSLRGIGHTLSTGVRALSQALRVGSDPA
jgi:glycosyltransferase involved in cell wall biosynthesis